MYRQELLFADGFDTPTHIREARVIHNTNGIHSVNKGCCSWNVCKQVTENRIALDNNFFGQSLAIDQVYLLCGRSERFLINRVSLTQLFGKKEGAGIEEGENGVIKTQ